MTEAYRYFGLGLADHNHDTRYPAGDPTAPTDGQVWTYDAASGGWIPKSAATGEHAHAKLDLIGHGYTSAIKNVRQLLTYGSHTKVVYESEDADEAGYFANSRYSPQKAGRYELYVYLYIIGLVSGDQAQLRVLKNGTLFATLAAVPAMASTADASTSGSALLNLNGTTDYVEIYTRVYGSGGNPAVFENQNNRVIIQHSGAGG